MDTQVNGGVDVAAVKDVVVTTLGVEERADAIHAETELLGSLPELDSMAVLMLVHDLEERFDIVVEDEDLSADVFATLRSLAAFVDRKTRFTERFAFMAPMLLAVA
ncbi:MAG: acyl carrier protein [Solirubrobacteraceae bacterium]|jgi:acyl carrier protein|nr:acyl carrier protein [Solirubrobacteraceae bacterium]